MFFTQMTERNKYIKKPSELFYFLAFIFKRIFLFVVVFVKKFKKIIKFLHNGQLTKGNIIYFKINFTFVLNIKCMIEQNKYA